MRAAKRQIKQKEVSSSAIKAKSTKENVLVISNELAHTESQNEKLDNSSLSDIQLVQLEYDKKIKLLEKAVEEANNRKMPLKKNEQKLINAIRSECLSQDTSCPIMTRSYIGRVYGINEKYLGESIKGLELKCLIKRSCAKTIKNQSTFMWEIL